MHPLINNLQNKNSCKLSEDIIDEKEFAPCQNQNFIKITKENKNKNRAKETTASAIFKTKRDHYGCID